MQYKKEITYPINFINPTEKTNPTASFAPAFRGQDQLNIYTYDYCYKTKEDKTGTNPWGFEAAVNQQGIVIELSDRVKIPQNGYVISGNSKGHDFILKNLELGSRVTYDANQRILTVYVDPVSSTLYSLNIKIKEIERRVSHALDSILLFDEKTVQNHLKEIHNKYEKLLNMQEKDNDLNFSMKAFLSLKEEILNLITTIYCLTTESASIESRGVWHRPHEKSLQELIQTLDIMQNCHFNTLYVETFFNGNVAGISSITDTVEEVKDGHYGKYGKDYLKALISEAHQRNIEVHAWVENFFVGEHIRFDKNYPQDFRMVNYDGSTMQGPGDGNSEIVENGFIFLDPANPKVHTYVLSIYKELLTNYAFDGFHIDYVRYPNGNLDIQTSNGYSEYAMNEFKEMYGYSSQEDVRELIKQEKIMQQWTTYRCDKITLLVQEVVSLVRSFSSNCKISMAVVPETEYAIKNKMQDWVKWVKNGWIDITLPMAYYFGTSEIEIATKNLVTFNENKAFSYTGISPNYEGVPSIMNAYQIEACIQNQAQGYAIFSLPNILNSKSVQEVLKLGPNRHVAVPSHGSLSLILKAYQQELLDKFPYFEKNKDWIDQQNFVLRLQQVVQSNTLEDAIKKIQAFLQSALHDLKGKSYDSFVKQTKHLLTILQIQQYQATKI